MSSVKVDPREGSKDLLPYLQELRVPSKLEKMEFGDVSVIGRGPEERPVSIGVEIKAPSDLLNSVRDGRFAGHQLPGLLLMYEQVYLAIEGMPIRGNNGELAWTGRKTRGLWKYDDLIGHLLTYQNKTGVHIVYTKGRIGTANWVAALWKWWNGKSYDKHRAHLAMQRIEPNVEPYSIYRLDDGIERKLKVAVSLAEGVGWTKAKAAALHFRSVRDMVNAEPEEWMKIDGFGKALSRRVVAEARRI